MANSNKLRLLFYGMPSRISGTLLYPTGGHMTPEQALSKAIRIQRMEKELSQEQLAEMSELDQTYLSQIECSKRQPSLKSLRKIAKALELDLSALFHNAEVREKESKYQTD